MSERARNDGGRARAPRCPVCAAPSVPGHAPFCSRRCGDVDLGRWLGGGYAIAGEPVGETQGDETQDGGSRDDEDG